jgi:hypothetical protein
VHSPASLARLKPWPCLPPTFSSSLPFTYLINNQPNETNQTNQTSIMHVVSQSDVIAFISKKVDDLGPLADRSLAQLGLASKAVVCVPGEMSTINALATMAVGAGVWGEWTPLPIRWLRFHWSQ